MGFEIFPTIIISKKGCRWHNWCIPLSNGKECWTDGFGESGNGWVVALPWRDRLGVAVRLDGSRIFLNYGQFVFLFHHNCNSFIHLLICTGTCWNDDVMPFICSLLRRKSSVKEMVMNGWGSKKESQKRSYHSRGYWIRNQCGSCY